MAGMTAAAASHIRAAAVSAYPRECCGLLLGRDDAIVEAWTARNLSHDPKRYQVDPRDHFAAIRAARGRGLDVIGAYHSHPDAPPCPSATDLDEAFPSFIYLIASVRGGRVEVRAWHLVGGNFAELPLVIEGEETLP